MQELYDTVCLKCSALATKEYSTSFTLGIKMLHKSLHQPIYGIYGFVRFADEIVDSFHDFDKQALLSQFKLDTYTAIDQKISLNPILQSFQLVVNQYNIQRELIDAFLLSMELDLHKKEYNKTSYENYIYGSAEVVGLMCLRIFVNGNHEQYSALEADAKSLGSAFQKINFLRDMKADYAEMGRMYFPGISIENFDENTKAEIITDIENDFQKGLEGIKNLPKKCRFGVYLAYVYYIKLLQKVKSASAKTLLNKRVRVADINKYSLLASSYVKHRLNMI